MSQTSALQCEQALERAWRRSDLVFDLIPPDRFLERPIGLRHPILFYVGHLPAFAWNQVGRGFLGDGHLDAVFDHLFERGIDPADEALAREQSFSSWPLVTDVLAYRDRVRAAIRERIGRVLERGDDVLSEHGRILQVVVEHELMHHETLMYMFAECPAGMISRPPGVLPPEDGAGKAAEVLEIPAGRARIGANFDEIPFGWDNEFGAVEADVPAFRLDSLPVRNQDWLEFLTKRHLDDKWLPQSWLRLGRDLFVKTVFGPVPYEMASGWPVQVSGEQARVYCAHRGGRLPTEAELHRAAYGNDLRRSRPWGDVLGDQEAGDFGFSRWYPSPVGRHAASASEFGVEELVGNGWEWTSTPFAPLPGFRPYVRTYPGYSADFFDDAHDVVCGASWATDEVFLRPSFRNWYRRSYPYAFTKFRVAF